MAELLLFAEDDAQERFVGTLIRRLANSARVPVDLHVRSGIGGFGGVLSDLKRLGQDCLNDRQRSPDIAVVAVDAVDANCVGVNERRRRVEEAAGPALQPRLVTAIADPHIERWYLLDGSAFKKTLGRGCDAPDHKCEKDRYKQLLANAVRAAGVEPLLGGIEYAEDLALELDLTRVGNAAPPLGAFLSSLADRLSQEKGRG